MDIFGCICLVYFWYIQEKARDPQMAKMFLHSLLPSSFMIIDCLTMSIGFSCFSNCYNQNSLTLLICFAFHRFVLIACLAGKHWYPAYVKAYLPFLPLFWWHGSLVAISFRGQVSSFLISIINILAWRMIREFRKAWSGMHSGNDETYTSRHLL